MKRRNPNQTLQATDIVHEAYLHLLSGENLEWADRTHFVGIAAAAMRQVIVDYGRRKGALKRGGGGQRIPLRDTLALSKNDVLDVVSLDEALQKLKALHERQARVVELRFFGGLSLKEVAAILDVSLRTVEGDWHTARAWLYRELKEE